METAGPAGSAVPNRLAHLLRIKRIPQRDIAAACGVNASTVSRWISGDIIEISDAHKVCVARTLGVSVDDLMAWPEDVRAVTSYGSQGGTST